MSIATWISRELQISTRIEVQNHPSGSRRKLKRTSQSIADPLQLLDILSNLKFYNNQHWESN